MRATYSTHHFLQVRGPVQHFITCWCFYSGDLLAPAEPPLVSCLRLTIQHIHSHPPYLKAISSISNLWKCHAVATREAPHYAVFSSLMLLNVS